MKTAVEILKSAGFGTISDLNYCLDNGIEYTVGYYKDNAGICALIHDENNYLIDKAGLREMRLTAKIKGINEVWLYTNYGLELKSSESPRTSVGINHIVKVNAETGKAYN